MKKLFIISVLTVCAAVLTTSCKKTYECHCETVSGGHEHIDIKGNEADAKKECEAKAPSTTYAKCEVE